MGIGTPFSMIGTATRHAMDINLTFGSASSRYNARDDYRNKYDGNDRAAAGIGVALGTAAPAMGLASWATKRGLRTPLAPIGILPQGAAKVAGIAALGAATGVGASKLYQITKDDGHLGAVAGTAGIVGGTLGGLKMGQKFAGKYAPIISGAAAIGGGIVGYKLGQKIDVGPGHIGEAHPQSPQIDEGPKDRATSMLRGGFNGFSEIGPTSQGVSFASWGQNDAFSNKYSNSERAGQMLIGDLGAAALLGGGALAAAGGLMRGNVAGAADAAGKVLSYGPLTQNVAKMSGMGLGGMAAAGVGITALAASKQFQQSVNTGNSKTQAGLESAAVVGAAAGTAALVSKSAAFKGLAAGPKAASSIITAAALIGALSAAQIPARQFISDAKLAHAARTPDSTTMMAVTGTTALAGGTGAFKTLNKMVPSGGMQIGKFRIPKAVMVGAGTLAGAAALGGAGFGMSATMPDIKKVGIAGGIGAAAGGAAGMVLGGMSPAMGAITGGALGVAASALMGVDADETAEILPMEGDEMQLAPGPIGEDATAGVTA